MKNRYLYVPPKIDAETSTKFNEIEKLRSIRDRYYTKKDWQDDYDNEIDNYIKPLKPLSSKYVIKNITGVNK